MVDENNKPFSELAKQVEELVNGPTEGWSEHLNLPEQKQYIKKENGNYVTKLFGTLPGDVDPEQVLNFACDFYEKQKINPKINEIVLLEEGLGYQIIYYNQKAGVPLVADRDAIVRIECDYLYPDGGFTVGIKTIDHPKDPKHKKRVRQVVDQYWQLKPRPDGSPGFELRLYLANNPNGNIPDAVINALIKKVPMQALEKLKTMRVKY